jgi:phage baseplate assembly protein W
VARYQRYNFNDLKPVYYRDFKSDFSLNPQTGLLAEVINEDSVKQSIKNLVLTNVFERPYQPLVGSKVQSLNFEMNDPVTYNLLQQTITETITNFEPRVQELSVQIIQDIDNNQIFIKIIFTTQNLTAPVSFDLLLPRVR